MNLSYRVAASVFHRMPLPRGKLARSRAGRMGAASRWIAWARDHRSTGPLIWLHGASVGEAQVTVPIVTRLRAKHPSVQVVQTYSSASMAHWPPPAGVDRADFAPAEQPEAATAVCQALRPAGVVVSRGDLWPQMTRAALSHGVPVAVVGAAMRPHSRRLHWPARGLLGPIHARLAFVGAVSPGDADRWLRSGAAEAAVCVTGDPRDDHVLERVTRLADIRPILDWASDPPTALVAGSTHPRDDRVLLRALAQMRAGGPPAKLLLVPHDPVPGAVRRARDQAVKLDITAGVWDGSSQPGDPAVLIVTRAGLLADLYTAGMVAYVGGGFDGGGVHSLAEPASLALPILTGPAARQSDPAARFLESGGVVALDGPDPAGQLVGLWTRWIEEPGRRTAAGLAARRCVVPGAAAATLARLEPFLGLGGM